MKFKILCVRHDFDLSQETRDWIESNCEHGPVMYANKEGQSGNFFYLWMTIEYKQNNPKIIFSLEWKNLLFGYWIIWSPDFLVEKNIFDFLMDRQNILLQTSLLGSSILIDVARICSNLNVLKIDIHRDNKNV